MVSMHHKVDTKLSGVQHVRMWRVRDGEKLLAVSAAKRRNWQDPAAAHHVALQSQNGSNATRTDLLHTRGGTQ